MKRAALASGERVSELACSAALLAATAFLWKQIHPTSHQLLQAIVVAIELSSGYAETKRKAATGAISTGPAPFKALKLILLTAAYNKEGRVT